MLYTSRIHWILVLILATFVLGDLPKLYVQNSGDDTADGLTWTTALQTIHVTKQQLTCQGKTAPLKPVDGKIRLEILVDRMSIEIYANGGLVYTPIGVNLTSRPATVQFVSQGGDTLIETLDIYQLKSIWF
jgi:fructan beta-fructosidase